MPAAFLASGLALACSLPAQALEPFIAHYQVFNGGKEMGDATMQVVRNDARRWRVDLGIHGTTGLMGLAGVNGEQSTVFDLVGDTYRPLSQGTVKKAVFTKRQTIGVYDWRALTARWQGDIKESRQKPVPIQSGDMSGLLINLAVIRDAQPGKTLQYRFVDNGRVRPHQYVVATESEGVKIGDMSFSAMRVNRVQSGNEETVIWVVEGVPTPVRILQRENGQDTYDLRLVEYKGA
ncbi:DUF3108 domain-containing protein [Lysobacter niastensis]|uniref:DUF3108 domain-containing protein n=2 Tax=Lysobacter niastensis TaxID=380629 RepID=A0ABS0B318_9GAMM|nr:DUF3108 domain-containing protein [Lysobacter niastensis]